MAPIANAGPDRTVSYHTTVSLDGTQSTDADGPVLEYHWTVDAIPAGSVAVLDDPTSARPTFQADIAGEYRFTLIVDDTIKSSAPSSVKLVVQNDRPIAVVQAGGNVTTGTPLTLDGSGSTDLNGDPITYLWSVASAPAGSTAQPASPQSAITTFTPDRDGAYELSLVVDDGFSSSLPAIVAATSFRHLETLPYGPIDVEYSAALDRLVMIATTPINALYIVDPSTGASTTVNLSKAPLTVSLSSDGLRAAVGQDHQFTVVDLQTHVIDGKGTNSISGDVILGDDGYGYAFADFGSPNRATQNVLLSTGALTEGDQTIGYKAKLLPNSTTIYLAAGVFHSMLNFSIATHSATAVRSVASDACGNLWISDDGLHILTACGTVFSISSSAASDMQLETTLPGGSVVGVAQAGSRLVTLTGDKLRSYTYPSFAFQGETTLSRFLISGQPYPGDGRFVFLRSDGLHYVVVERVSLNGPVIEGFANFDF